jgi:hypothetical protein
VSDPRAPRPPLRWERIISGGFALVVAAFSTWALAVWGEPVSDADRTGKSLVTIALFTSLTSVGLAARGPVWLSAFLLAVAALCAVLGPMVALSTLA